MFKPSYQLIDYRNPVFKSYVVWSGVLVLKLLAMSWLTMYKRYRTKTHTNPEDLNMGRAENVKFGNDDVERVRRAHRNDMENILPYLTIGLFYCLTDPPVTVAAVLFRIATIARCLHTFVYAVVVIPQPARGICFGLHALITFYMTIVSILYFF